MNYASRKNTKKNAFLDRVFLNLTKTYKLPKNLLNPSVGCNGVCGLLNRQ